ncbi:hypothetical protein OPQ81_006657 [Rhizoctonia solani]|nr:hypothetical protein OPQ81_006657 [Rhizoctonia solani]
MSPNNAKDNPSILDDTPAKHCVIAIDEVATNATTAPELDDELKLAKPSGHRRPWYKTPSVWWILPIMTVSAMFQASTFAPQTELFIKFACDELRPEYRIDLNRVQMGPTLNDAEVDVPVTFIQSNPSLGDRIMKPTIFHPDKRCAEDAAVQGAAAKLSAWITGAQGILSCLTLGWWTQYSDRAGRTKLLAISSLTGLLTDTLLFLVTFKADMLPGGYRVLILGGVIRGLSGGFYAVVAAAHAYVADCSSPLARSRIFSIWAGCLQVGAALGPSLGSLINYYSNDLLSIFYICTLIHVIYAILVAFIVPESLSDEARDKAQELYRVDINHHPQTILRSLRQLTSFARPLGVFIPKQAPTGERGRTSREWNLALVGAAAGAVGINVGSHHFRYQYALKTFHWSSVELGNWLSIVGFWRALYLSIILPAILKTLYTLEERLSGGTHNDDEKEAQVKKIDLLVVRVSLLIDLVGYILVGIVTSQVPFIGATIILVFGGGFAPSVQSLTLALANPSADIARREARTLGTSPPSNAKKEIGRLFGALALIHSLGAQVIGPALFGTTFGATIGVYPRAIFWLCAIIMVFALGALGAVRLDIGATAENSEHTPLLA